MFKQAHANSDPTSSQPSLSSLSAKMVTWETSPENEHYVKNARPRSTRRGWLAVMLTIASGLCLTYSVDHPGYGILGLMGIAVTVSIVLWSMVPYWIARRSYFERVQAEKARAVEDALTRLEGKNPSDSLSLPALFIFNRRQLDEYQMLTKRHAAVSFRNAQVAAGIGLSILVVGALLVFQQGSSSAQYAIGGLSGLGTLLGVYLSRTYFQSHKDAMRQLAIYYEEPFLTSRALSAERMIAKIPYLGIAPSDANLSALIYRLLNPASLVSNHSDSTKQGEDSVPSTSQNTSLMAIGRRARGRMTALVASRQQQGTQSNGK